MNYSSINLSKAVPSLCPLLLESTQKILLICTYLLWIPFAPGHSWFFPIGVYYLGTDDCTKMPGVTARNLGVTVEPRYMEEPRDWQILFSVRRLRYFKVLFNKVLLLLWQRKWFVIPTNLLYRGSVIPRFHCVIFWPEVRVKYKWTQVFQNSIIRLCRDRITNFFRIIIQLVSIVNL